MHYTKNSDELNRKQQADFNASSTDEEIILRENPITNEKSFYKMIVDTFLSLKILKSQKSLSNFCHRVLKSLNQGTSYEYLLKNSYNMRSSGDAYNWYNEIIQSSSLGTFKSTSFVLLFPTTKT